MFYVYITFYLDNMIGVYPNERMAATWVENQYQEWPLTPEGQFRYRRAELKD